MKVGTTQIGLAREITRYLRDGLHLVGIGNTDAWQGGITLDSSVVVGAEWEIEGSPPEVSPTLTDLPNLIGFFPVSRIRPVVQHPQGAIQLADGTRYFEIDASSEAELAQAGVSSLLLECDVVHASLPTGISSYRSYGLYVGCSCNHPISDTVPLITVADVPVRTLDRVTNMPRVLRENGLVHRLQFVRRFA